MSTEESSAGSPLHNILGLMMLTAVLVLVVVITILLMQRGPRPARVSVGTVPVSVSVQTVADEECPNVLDGSPKGLGCTEATAKADFTTKARQACVDKCAESKWEGRDCIRFGYTGSPLCTEVEGTDCPDGKGWQCKLGRGVGVECVCQCSAST